jgi:outer membrane protein assembly factor BamA
MKKYLRIIFTCFCLFLVNQTHAQEKEKLQRKKNQFFHNIFKRVKSSITAAKPDSATKATILNTKSVIPFNEHRGKVIRSITTQELGFEKIFTDTSKLINYYGTRILNALHTDTYDWVIRDNLFIKKGSRLNPYMLSDNERYLRSLEFIQDARILVKPIIGNADSVDIVVITKDLFSITGSLDIGGAERQKLRAAETNLAGAGQKIQVTALRDINRQPVFGYDFLYSKNSIAHSFVTGSLGYSRINNDRTGRDNVEATYFLLHRPLISPYSRAAGGLELRFNKSANLYREPDSVFRNYQNASLDVWAGYNIGVKNLIKDNKSRDRTFVAIRYLRNNFSQTPLLFSKGYNTLFNSINARLAK